MGRWDNRNASTDDERRDEWQKQNKTNFDWKETPKKKHEKDCTCPKCEYLIEQRKSFKGFPITHKFCPDHYRVWHEVKDEMMGELKWWERWLIQMMMKNGMIIIKELSYMQSDLCLWCKFGSGGHGNKKTIKPIH